MQFNNSQTQFKSTVSAQARMLMSQTRQKQQNRHQSMLQRAATEVGLEN